MDEKRNSEQNRAQWVYLNEWAKTKTWQVNGAATKLSAEDWKSILTVAFEGETRPRVAPGLNGGMVFLGQRTSNYGKKRFSEWLDFLAAISAEHDIKIPAQFPS